MRVQFNKSGENHLNENEQSAKDRTVISRLMTRSQIEKAQQLSREWLENKGK